MNIWYLASMVFCCAFLSGNTQLHQQAVEDCILASMKEIREAKPDQLWMFDGRAYLLNESGQWEPASYEVPGNFESWLADLSRRGVCPKEHRGVYLDQTFYESGIWCCRGVLRDGKRCPYHIDVQYPNGIPKSE